MRKKTEQWSFNQNVITSVRFIHIIYPSVSNNSQLCLYSLYSSSWHLHVLLSAGHSVWWSLIAMICGSQCVFYLRWQCLNQSTWYWFVLGSPHCDRLCDGSPLIRRPWPVIEMENLLPLTPNKLHETHCWDALMISKWPRSVRSCLGQLTRLHFVRFVSRLADMMLAASHILPFYSLCCRFDPDELLLLWVLMKVSFRRVCLSAPESVWVKYTSTFFH